MHNFYVVCMVNTINSNTNDMLQATSRCGLYVMAVGSLFHKYIKLLQFFCVGWNSLRGGLKKM